MDSGFVKMDKVPYRRCCIQDYSKMDIDKFICDALPKIARQKTEKWGQFEKRRQKAIIALDTFVFGRLYGKQFDFERIPKEYADYQYSSKSEFGRVARRGIIAGISVSINEEEVQRLQTGDSTDIKRILSVNRIIPNDIIHLNKINTGSIGYAFNYWESEQFLLYNTANYVNSNCDNQGRISVTRWITATGKNGRTKEIESLDEGCSLKWIQRASLYSNELTIISPNGKEIGEINWKYEDGHLDDTEFNTVYEPLLRNKCASIESISLHRLIPHNTPKGRPRKALVQVLITLQVQKLEIDECRIEQIKHDIQYMRTLAAIDYNRKCDIIEGKIPEKLLSLEELFCDDEFLLGNPFATYDVLRSKGFLSGSAYTNSELEELWSIYMPVITFCSRKEQEMPIMSRDKNRLFCKRHHFSYVLDYEQGVSGIGERSYNHNILKLSLYRRN